jgi:hypothetical protein
MFECSSDALKICDSNRGGGVKEAVYRSLQLGIKSAKVLCLHKGGMCRLAYAANLHLV